MLYYIYLDMCVFFCVCTPNMSFNLPPLPPKKKMVRPAQSAGFSPPRWMAQHPMVTNM